MAKKDRRTRKIDVRFTEEEYKIIEALEVSLGMRKTDLVRSRLLNDGIRINVDARAMLTELNRIGAALGRAGNNINQLARHANILNKKGRLTPIVVEQFNALFSGYIEQQQMLEQALRKILRSFAA